MNNIVERLNDIWRDDDHERGCTGRNYECKCGFDARSFATAKEAAIEIERLRAKIAEARVDALEAQVNEDRHFFLKAKAAEERCAKLEKALEKVCTAIEREPVCGGDLDYPHGHNDWLGWRKKIMRPAAEFARAALDQDKGGGDG